MIQIYSSRPTRAWPPRAGWNRLSPAPATFEPDLIPIICSAPRVAPRTSEVTTALLQCAAHQLDHRLIDGARQRFAHRLRLRYNTGVTPTASPACQRLCPQRVDRRHHRLQHRRGAGLRRHRAVFGLPPACTPPLTDSRPQGQARYRGHEAAATLGATACRPLRRPAVTAIGFGVACMSSRRIAGNACSRHRLVASPSTSSSGLQEVRRCRREDAARLKSCCPAP